jgi:hypothetical protein
LLGELLESKLLPGPQIKLALYAALNTDAIGSSSMDNRAAQLPVRATKNRFQQPVNCVIKRSFTFNFRLGNSSSWHSRAYTCSDAEHGLSKRVGQRMGQRYEKDQRNNQKQPFGN